MDVSLGRTGNGYDNAAMESFLSTFKCEWVHHQDCLTRARASLDSFEYIAVFYNTVRRISTLGYMSPNEFEAKDRKSL